MDRGEPPVPSPKASQPGPASAMLGAVSVSNCRLRLYSSSLGDVCKSRQFHLPSGYSITAVGLESYVINQQPPALESL